jgi:murein DD-endopeptidase MepM/ murein hydrolase activator NlpD
LSSKEESRETEEKETKKVSVFPVVWISVLSWGVTLILVAALVLVLLQINPFKKKAAITETVDSSPASSTVPLPNLSASLPIDALFRIANIDTKVPDGIRQYPVKYTVQAGDSLFTIAKTYNITPETIFWANYDLLSDDPIFLQIGWQLIIPPVDGVYYKWQKGDTLEKVAEKYFVTPDDIIQWPANHLDVINPVTDNLDYVMIPFDNLAMVSWVRELPFAPRSGATQIVGGPGSCQTATTGPVGSQNWVWPVPDHYLSGYGFTSYHLGIDLAAGTGTPVVASDNGTVIYAGWNDTGYGNLIEIDHNNGYKTIYGHLSSFVVACGDNVVGGQLIAFSGASGKATGPHLHFEIRDNGSFIDPFTVLP